MEKGGAELQTVTGRVQIRLPFLPAPELLGKPLYVVFRDSEGNLRAFAASYDAASGELVFETELLGEFVLIAMEEPVQAFSPEFYAALAELEEVKKLR